MPKSCHLNFVRFLVQRSKKDSSRVMPHKAPAEEGEALKEPRKTTWTSNTVQGQATPVKWEKRHLPFLSCWYMHKEERTKMSFPKKIVFYYLHLRN